MAQIVKPDVGQLGPLEKDLKDPLHEIPLIQRVTARIHKDQICRRGIAIAGVALHGLGRAIIGEQLDDRRLKLH